MNIDTKAMKKGILIILVTCLSIISCKKIIDSAASLDNEDIKIEDLKIVKVNDNYSIAVPKYMSEMKSLHDEASFEYANIFKETYTVVLDESKQDFIDTFKELQLYIDSVTPLKNYSDIQLQNFQETIANLKTKSIVSKIRNVPSEQYEFHGKVDGINIGYLISFIEGNEKMFLVMSWTLENRYKKYINTFKLIHTSFKQL